MAKRRRRLAAFVALVAIALAGSGLWMMAALTGTDVMKAAVAKSQSLGDLIGERSPGARSSGELVKTKTKQSRVLARSRPAQRPGIGPNSAASKTEMVVNPLLGTPALVSASVDWAPPAPAEELGVPPPTLGGIVLPGPEPGGPSGGPPPATFPGPGPGGPVLEPSAVPEPGTWATMLIGFAMLGWHCRHRTRIMLPARS
ncbi:MAG TPA: PEPxxWA-CTERM sorting domain-containing protein [Sphingomicrobium sp.]|nr:PEPxxWA-CTERM sorting domain-containing protein [Sphingomicrobium sp.]